MATKRSHSVNWKSRALAAEKERDELKNNPKVPYVFEAGIKELREELSARPTVKETTTYGLPWLFWVFFCTWFGEVLWMTMEIQKLQTPILSPYPVYIAKYVPPDPYALDVCKDAWRADERTIRQLKRRLEP